MSKPWYPQYDNWRRSPWSARKQASQNKKLDAFQDEFDQLASKAGELALFKMARSLHQARYDLEVEIARLKMPRRFGPFFSEDYCQVCAIRLGLPRDYVSHCDKCGDKEKGLENMHPAHRPVPLEPVTLEEINESIAAHRREKREAKKR